MCLRDMIGMIISLIAVAGSLGIVIFQYRSTQYLTR